MRILALLIFILFSSCSGSQTNDMSLKENIKPSLGVIQVSFPLRLDELNVEDTSHNIQLTDERIVFKLEETLHEYIKDIEFSDPSQNARDLYINTIQLHDSLHSIFVMLLKNYPTGEINTKVLFYDNEKKEFVKGVFEFKLHALYDLVNGKLTPTNLRTEFNIRSPEIEQVDYNKDGKVDYKFKRLWHNGTFNALHTIIVTVNPSGLDTLYFCEEGLGELTKKKNCL